MKILDLKDKYEMPIAVALGFFDCIHKGHHALVRSACKYAQTHDGVESALLTFSNDPSELLGRDKQIYRFEERANALGALGLQALISVEFNKRLASLNPDEFLDMLTENLNIKAVITGRDYTFGRGAEGDIVFIRSYFKNRGVEVIVEPFEEHDGKKLSTSSLRALIKTGDIASLNAHLSEPYFMIDEVVHARHVGRELGFPTANIRIADNRLPLADGVYATVLQADEKCYASMTNVGAKPTFGIKIPSVESYILDFDGDLYGKTVKLSYIFRMRETVEFASAEALMAQLIRDEAEVRKLIRL